MSEMVKHSNSTTELKLFLRLFPYSPYRKTFEKKVFQLDPRETFQTIYRSSAQNLTAKDEITMSRLVKQSTNPKELNLFIKLFPDSPFRAAYEERLSQKNGTKRSKNRVLSEEEKEEHEELEKKLLDELPDETVVPAKEKEPEPVLEQELETKKEPQAKKEDEKEEPEEDWAKLEVGIPLQLALFDSNDELVETDGSPIGFFIGWSHEVLFDIGGGTGLEYFSQELGSNNGNLQHLFLEAQIRGQLFNLVNWGLGWGSGITTIQLVESSANPEIVPGSGTILTLSLGLVYGSFGINYTTSSFTGSYQSIVTAGASSTTSTINWTGSVNMLTFEYLY